MLFDRRMRHARTKFAFGSQPIKFTPVERLMLQLLSDGHPHTKHELRECLVKTSGALTNIEVHLSHLRRVLAMRQETILCVFWKRKRCYQHVGPITGNRGEVSAWLYAEWRDAVVQRDGPYCVDCKTRGKTKLADSVHHIKPWRHYPSLRLEPDNGVHLCVSCHTDRDGTLRLSDRQLKALSLDAT